VNLLVQGENNYLRQTSTFTRTTISGRSALATTLMGRSPITGGEERVTVIIVAQLPNRQAFYMAAVSLQDEFMNYQRAFNYILRSLQLNARQ
jgi:hypothetical protein